jgi:hypothetical protein
MKIARRRNAGLFSGCPFGTPQLHFRTAWILGWCSLSRQPPYDPVPVRGIMGASGDQQMSSGVGGDSVGPSAIAGRELEVIDRLPAR